MVTRYSVIQFSPNAVSGERINIGVIAYTESESKVAFLSNWRRVRVFSGGEVEFLKEFADEMKALVSKQLPLPAFPGPANIESPSLVDAAASWQNSITFTPPRASVRDVQDLIPRLSKEFLTQPSTRDREYRDRRSAASIAKSSLHKALEEREGKENVDKYLHSQREVLGKFGPHVFDAVVANGTPRIAAQGISFELPAASQLDQLVDAVAFQVFDVMEANPKLHIAILALPPIARAGSHSRNAFSRATRTYKGLRAEVVLEQDADEWARSRLSHISL